MTREEIIVFGKWMKEQREALQLSQSQLAARLEIAPGSVSTIEAGIAKSVGPKMEEKIRNFFAHGALHPHPATNTLKTLNLTGLETLAPAIRRIAALSLSSDFHVRVRKVQEALGCTEAEAASQIFLWELQKR